MLTQFFVLPSKYKPSSGNQIWFYLFYQTLTTTGWDTSRSGTLILNWKNTGGTLSFSLLQINPNNNVLIDCFDATNGYINFYHFWIQNVIKGYMYITPFL